MSVGVVLSKEGVSRRIALWSALLTVHTVFLAAAFAVVLATHTPADWLITLVGFFALLGILISLLLLAEAVTLDDERSTQAKPLTYAPHTTWYKHTWVASSFASPSHAISAVVSSIHSAWWCRALGCWQHPHLGRYCSSQTALGQ